MVQWLHVTQNRRVYYRGTGSAALSVVHLRFCVRTRSGVESLYEDRPFRQVELIDIGLRTFPGKPPCMKFGGSP